MQIPITAAAILSVERREMIVATIAQLELYDKIRLERLKVVVGHFPMLYKRARDLYNAQIATNLPILGAISRVVVPNGRHTLSNLATVTITCLKPQRECTQLYLSYVSLIVMPQAYLKLSIMMILHAYANIMP